MTETVEAKPAPVWPTRADGTNKRMGEMTTAEYLVQMAAARARFYEKNIADLEARLSLRDTFICEKGLWDEFATTVLAKAAA